MVHKDTLHALDSIDAAVFSGDAFMSEGGRKILREHLERWNRWDKETGYYAEDGTFMNADGTRSVFDDVDV